MKTAEQEAEKIKRRGERQRKETGKEAKRSRLQEERASSKLQKATVRTNPVTERIVGLKPTTVGIYVQLKAELFVDNLVDGALEGK